MPSPFMWSDHFARRLWSRYSIRMTTQIRDEILMQILASAQGGCPLVRPARYLRADAEAPSRAWWQVELEGRPVVVVLELLPAPGLVTALPAREVRHG